MSEKLRQSSHEIHIPSHESREHERRIAEQHEKAAEKAGHENKEIDKILQKIENQAESAESIKKHHLDNNQKINSVPIVAGGELRDRTLQRTIKGIQKKLPPLQKSFSKVIHNPAIDTVSEATSKTIARPSGLLFGGMASLIVSLLTMFISRYYGYRYNFLVGLLAFVGGFFLGLLIESVMRLTKHKSVR